MKYTMMFTITEPWMSPDRYTADMLTLAFHATWSSLNNCLDNGAESDADAHAGAESEMMSPNYISSRYYTTRWHNDPTSTAQNISHSKFHFLQWIKKKKKQTLKYFPNFFFGGFQNKAESSLPNRKIPSELKWTNEHKKNESW
jgi:hypothetical protein